MQRCPKCGKEYSDEANFCPVDAATLVPLDGAEADGDDGLVGGRFRLGEPIGGSRTGEVYGAVDEQEGTDCVLKVVADGVFPTPLVLQRNERELKKLAKLDAPGIAKVLAYGRVDKKLWIASEAVEGSTLREIVDSQGPLLPNQAAELINTIGEALSAAVKIGIAHRDLAPKNVLVTDELNVKLINFGVPVPATTGKASGVAEFNAPEQLKGKPIDQRSNIFSLGALYYFALTGTPPTPGQAPANVDRVSAGTNAVLAKALEQSSSKRYMTLRQFLREVSNAADKDAGSTQPMGQAGKALASSANAATAPKSKKELKQTLVGGFAVVDGAVKATGGAAAGAAVAASGVIGGSIGGSDGAAAKASSDAAKPNLKSTVMGHTGIEDAQSDKATAEMDAEASQDPHPGATLGGLPAAPPASSLDAPAEPPVAAAAPVVTPAPAPPPAEDSASVTAPASKRAVSEANTVGGSAAVAAGAAGAAANVLARAASEVGAAGVSSAKEPSSPKKSASPGGKGKGKRKSGANKKKRRSNKGKFRETMWFKKGQLDAEAAKRAATGQDKQGLPESDKADEMPMEDRYADDGSLSHEDKDKFSLRTGHTEMMAAIPDQPKSAAGVSEDDLVREMQGGRGKYIAAIVVGVVALIGLIVMFASGGGGSDDEEEKTPDAAPAAKKQPVKKPVKKAPTIPKEATAAAAGFAKACVAGDAAAGWALLGPELQKKLYNDPVAKNRKYRRWRARIGYKGKAAKLDGKTYFALLMKKQSKWSPCSNADKFDVKGVKHDKDTLTMASSATEGPKALTFMKVGDKWLLTAIAWNKNK